MDFNVIVAVEEAYTRPKHYRYSCEYKQSFVCKLGSDSIQSLMVSPHVFRLNTSVESQHYSVKLVQRGNSHYMRNIWEFM